MPMQKWSVAGMKRTRLSLYNKIKILNYTSENPKQSFCGYNKPIPNWENSNSNKQQFGKKLQKEYEFFKSNRKKTY